MQTCWWSLSDQWSVHLAFWWPLSDWSMHLNWEGLCDMEVWKLIWPICAMEIPTECIGYWQLAPWDFKQIIITVLLQMQWSISWHWVILLVTQPCNLWHKHEQDTNRFHRCVDTESTEVNIRSAVQYYSSGSVICERPFGGPIHVFFKLR